MNTFLTPRLLSPDSPIETTADISVEHFEGADSGADLTTDSVISPDGEADLSREIMTDAGKRPDDQVPKPPPVRKSSQPIETPKEDDEPEDEVKPPAPLIDVDGTLKPKFPKGERDYSKFDPEDVPFLKSVPNHAFAHLEKKLVAARELQQKVKELESAPPKGLDVFTHPESYMLLDDYKKHATQASRIAYEADVLQQQLEGLEDGGTIKMVVGWQNGQPILEERTVSKSMVQNLYLEGKALAHQSRMAAEAIRTQHQENYTRAVSEVESKMKSYFPWETDAKRLDDPAFGEKKVKDVLTDFISMVPPQIRSQLMTRVAANLFAVTQMYAQKILAQNEQLQVSETARKNRRQAEPVSGSGVSSGNGKGKLSEGDVSLEDFVDVD